MLKAPPQWSWGPYHLDLKPPGVGSTGHSEPGAPTGLCQEEGLSWTGQGPCECFPMGLCRERPSEASFEVL